MQDLLVGVFLIIVAAVAMTAFGNTSCKAKGASFDAVTYGPIQGCMVKHKGRWLPLENIRGFD